jgi:aryl-alcohol dehydrogenase-like predicted oxidoreductase
MTNKIILGTVQFGLNYGINNKTGQPSISDVFNILDFAKHNGINTIDTADAYGTASKIIGDYLKINPGTFWVNTKFKKSNIQVKKQLYNSLKDLKIDRVNVYFYHSFNDFILHPELLEELEELKNIGLINKIGVSVYDNNELKEAIACEAIDTIQLPFNLLDNYTQRGKLLEQAKLKGNEIQARSVFLQGLFFISPNELPSKLLPLKKYLKILLDITSSNQITVEELAVQYAINQPDIDYIVIGVDNLEQLEKNLIIARKNLRTKTIHIIDNINVAETELLYPKNWK